MMEEKYNNEFWFGRKPAIPACVIAQLLIFNKMKGNEQTYNALMNLVKWRGEPNIKGWV